ncbi:secreted aspartic proteinase precursor [Microdochium trichocladiopsis]|uniref:Secreted aspartic proteinase n=1 Tax=Microdochium trichocladiopsis TaxID=1682393 RepID=A0A9P8Y0R3_9PEZI|nr:secreted aspartic proteinase precursor [Microdochium trichocladiopsis]KAH7025108.1 secreted aspartic proteinase precursor [Microdochium trichocladiopsis]
MHALTSTLVAAAIVQGGLAATVPSHARLGLAGTASFVAPRKTLENFNGALSVYNAHLKFGATPPPALAALVANITSAVNQRRSTGSVTTSPIDSDDDAYDANVQIGTPAQTLSLDFDTGSSDLWVFSSETPSSQRNGQSIYTPSKSSTASKLSGATWQISYGDGSSSSGDVYKDTVTIGGLTVTGQAVESAKKVSSSFTQESATDGLVGLAFSSINTVSPTKQKTFFDNAKSALNSPLFTADLKHQAAGKYNFGYIDTAAYTGSITYVPVDTSEGFWGFTSSGYAVGSGSFKSTKTSGIADTGTTLLYLPDSVVSAYYGQIKGAGNDDSVGGYTFPCSATPPSFTFGVGSGRITIPGSFMNFGDAGDGSCFGGIQSSDSIGINIYGDVALKAAFVVFSGTSSPQLGWASKSL